MLSRLIAFSLSQRLLMGILSLALLAAGVMALRNLPIDAFPDVSTTMAMVRGRCVSSCSVSDMHSILRRWHNGRHD